MRSSLPEIPRSALVFGRFGIVENTTDGQLYRAHRDELGDLEYATGIVAFYCDEAGIPVLLERSPGPQSRQELEQQRAAREQRRTAPSPRRTWMR